MINPQRLLQLDDWLKFPYIMLERINRMIRYLFPAKLSDEDTILIIKVQGMGSMVKLVSMYQQAEVDLAKIVLCTFKQNEAICKALGFGECIVIDSNGPFRLLVDGIRKLAVMRKYKPRYIVDLERGSYGLAIYRMMVSLLTRAKSISFSFDAEDKEDQNQVIFSMNGRTHADLFLKTIPYCPKGRSVDHLATTSVVPNKVIINVNASDYIRARKYPLKDFQQVITQLLQANPDLQVYLSGSPNEKEYVDRLIGLFPSDAPLNNMCGKWSIEALLIQLASCQLFLTNDSGPMHLGAYLGIPMVVIWGPTDPRHSGYENSASIQNISLQMPCAPCFTQPRSIIGTSCEGRIDCMHQLPPETIVTACLKMMKTQQEERKIIRPIGIPEVSFLTA